MCLIQQPNKIPTTHTYKTISFLPTRLGTSLDELLTDSLGDGERRRFRFGKGGGLSVCLEICYKFNNQILRPTKKQP